MNKSRNFYNHIIEIPVKQTSFKDTMDENFLVLKEFTAPQMKRAHQLSNRIDNINSYIYKLPIEPMIIKY